MALKALKSPKSFGLFVRFVTRLLLAAKSLK
jgi:hypothetical protein